MNPTLFLLLVLTASWTGPVQCEDNEETETEGLLDVKAEGEEENPDNHGDGSGDGRRSSFLDVVSTPSSDSVNNQESEPTTEKEKETNTDADAEPKTVTDADIEDLNPVIMIIIPLVLTLVIITVIVCVVIIYRRRRIRAETKEDPYLDHEDHEKVPMPMFDDDIPSVMELEMEDLENWMAKDGGKKVDTGQI
ncbi:transmembrane protein 154 [Carassius gibelio]|uniref:transmembrane protein 154 n=1 Tax=Carassius gibelio TaxID=101364 RepID=UPI002278CF41|nr:transmembrane protein 154 [Carassius gibelio]XP_052408521.1 transmembrane protein 154 [Carassius gibelio]XP_052408624.1 transmembrane protein 154 [Carassius gibelio]